MKIRVMLVREGRKPKRSVCNPEMAYNFLRAKAERLNREHVWRIDLDARNRIIDYEVVSVGTLTASLIHPREIYTGALLASAAGIIIAHNHPSNDPDPSAEDKEITRRIQKGGELLGIPLIDHLIITDTGYFSFKERGVI